MFHFTGTYVMINYFSFSKRSLTPCVQNELEHTLVLQCRALEEKDNSFRKYGHRDGNGGSSIVEDISILSGWCHSKSSCEVWTTILPD